MGTGKQYDEEFKKQAIKLAKEIGTKADYGQTMFRAVFTLMMKNFA